MHHPHAIVHPEATVGEDTQIGPFSIVESGVITGTSCRIGSHVVIERGAFLGSRVMVQSGVKIAAGTRIENDVTIEANATFAGQSMNAASAAVSGTTVGPRCRIGANATIAAGIKIGQDAAISAGAVVTRSVPPNAILSGQSAQITDYVTSKRADAVGQVTIAAKDKRKHAAVHTAIAGVTLHHFPRIEDLRGDLSVGEFQRDIPFSPKRYFLVFNVQNSEIRGEHAHRKCHQFLICIAGSCSVVVDNGQRREEFLLDSPTRGLYIPPMIWATQYKYSPDGVLLVYASDYYDPADYIRDYEEFLAATQTTAK